MQSKVTTARFNMAPHRKMGVRAIGLVATGMLALLLGGCGSSTFTSISKSSETYYVTRVKNGKSELLRCRPDGKRTMRCTITAKP